MAPVKCVKPHARGERKPGERLVLILQKQRFQMARRRLVLRQRESRAIVGDQVHGLVVVLAEAVDSCRRIVPCGHRRNTICAPAYCDPAVLRGADRRVVRVAVIVGAVVVIERRNGEQQARLERVRPGESRERVALPLDVADSGCLGVRDRWEFDNRRRRSDVTNRNWLLASRL